MSKAAAARRLATAAAVGSGGLGLVGGSLYGVLKAEAALARLKIGNATEVPPDPSGLYGFNLGGEPLRLAVLGDSAAAGYGAQDPTETFGAYLAAGLAELAQAPVFLSSVARVGAQTSALPEQFEKVRAARPHVCAVIIGANDVTHSVRPSKSISDLHAAVALMREAECEVVVGTCPDLGTIRPIAPPLRQVARRWSRRLAASQAITVVEAGGRAVSLGTILGPEFDSAPHDMFGPDRFHPSPMGYRSCAAAMLPTVAAALGFEDDDAIGYQPARGEGVYSAERGAAAAADSTGTELSQAEGTGGRGRWVSLRRRRRVAIPDVGEVSAELDEAAQG